MVTCYRRVTSVNKYTPTNHSGDGHAHEQHTDDGSEGDAHDVLLPTAVLLLLHILRFSRLRRLLTPCCKCF